MGLERMVSSLPFSFISFSILLFWIRFRVPDLSLPDHHPRRNFIRRSIELEIRLAYFDRILKTLPEAYQVPDVGVIPDQAPGPEFDYDDPRRCPSRSLFYSPNPFPTQYDRTMMQPNLF